MDVYNMDETADKVDSSNFMWCLAMYIDYDSIYFYMNTEDRKATIMEIYTPQVFNTIQTIHIDKYNLLQNDSEKRYLATWNLKVDEIDKVIKDTPITLENMEDITKQLLNLDKLLKQKDEITKRVNKKQVDERNRGGGQASVLESDMLG
jgi:hypothetical protein